ncbi:hypothetical protein H6H02_01400 [Coleofasciculus sp. FACHB-1120]|nr:hypothetical protein [Coleofasciculus sp. FACHB-1120]
MARPLWGGAVLNGSTYMERGKVRLCTASHRELLEASTQAVNQVNIIDPTLEDVLNSCAIFLNKLATFLWKRKGEVAIAFSNLPKISVSALPLTQVAIALSRLAR